MIEPFTKEELEEGLTLLAKGWSECTEIEQKKRVDFLARLELPENGKAFASRLRVWAQPRNIP